jgi:molybdopterin-biosynthesis enzyme MoeA-like protein
VCKYRNVYVLPGVPSIFRRKFAAIKEQFRAAPFTVERVYCNGDEGTLAPHLDAVVAAHVAVQIGSYPRFEETTFRVLLTLESKDLAAVQAARRDLVARLGALVVKVDEAE